MTFGQFVAILRARWAVVVLVLALCVAGSLVVSLLMPKQYTGSASVVVDFKPDPLTAFAFGGMASPGFMATQVDIIRSDRVAQRVVGLMQLSENTEVRAEWQEATAGRVSLESWLATRFQTQLDVVPSRESSVIQIIYTSPNANFAATMANAFMQAYLDTALELRTDPARRFAEFFDTRAKEAREALEKAQGKLSAFQEAKGIFAAEERLDVETARLNELSSQLTAMQAISAESGSRQGQAQGAQADRLQEVINNSLLSNLKAEISRSEAQLQQITTRLGDNHPQVIEARASLGELRRRLEAETRKVTGSVGVTNTINRQREGDVRAALARQREKVLKLKAVRDEGQLLQRDLENAQRTYDLLLQRQTQTSLESQTTLANVNVLSRASPSLTPSSPRLLYNSLVATFVGSLLGLLAAFGLEALNRRVRTVDDVTLALGLPVLGNLPAPGGRRLFGGRRLPAMNERLVGTLPGAAKAT